jgi:serine/threonine protein kinase
VSERADCPDEIELSRLTTGTLPGERAAKLREHLADCDACRAVVAAVVEPTDDAPGADRYELRRLVATGGMGEVFLARDRVLARDVAVKLLHEDAASPDALETSRRRLLREARALARLAHPNVVAVYDHGVLDGRAFLAMEFVRGRTLRQWIAEEKPSARRVVDVLVQAGHGLAAAHDLGIVHRDFKPDNVLVGDDGRARVTDFGLARDEPPADSRPAAPDPMVVAVATTMVSAVSGTPAYMAPEQRAGRPADVRSDQYAFAVTLDEAIHGDRAPSRDTSRDPFVAHVGRVTARARSDDPALRYRSVRDLLDALETPPSARRTRVALLALATVVVVAVFAGVFARRAAPRAPSSAAPPIEVPPPEDLGADDDATSDGVLGFAYPDEKGMDARPLVALADWISKEGLPILSVVVSRDGAVVFELYTTHVGRDDAHYLMGATTAVTSAVVGAALDRGVVPSLDATVVDMLPPDLFPSDAARGSFRRVTIRDVLAMSALDASVSPLDRSIATEDRQRQFIQAPNRVRFALTQPLVAQPGKTFVYTDVTPILAAGILEYATKKTLLELAEDWLFRPMDFRSYEWMHQDAAGIDNAGYGLRLRPIDMQKLGVLHLQNGLYAGRALLPRAWVREAFTPVVKQSAAHPYPSYGAYWRTVRFGSSTAHVAQGWKGQRIAVFRKARLVVTMTGVIEPPRDETILFRRVVEDYVLPAALGTPGAPPRPDPSLRAALGAILARIADEPHLPPMGVEGRMIPSASPKERHHAFAGDQK